MEVSPEIQARFEQLAKLPKAARAGILVAIVAVIWRLGHLAYAGLGT